MHVKEIGKGGEALTIAIMEVYTLSLWKSLVHYDLKCLQDKLSHTRARVHI